MRFRTLLWGKDRQSSLAALGIYAAGGFAATLLLLAGRAPLAIALVSAVEGRGQMLAALCGSVAGALALMDFSAGLRHCGILVLLYAAFSAFRDTKYMGRELFRPLTAMAMTAAVELAYLLQEGLSLQAVAGYLTYLVLVGVSSHYLALQLGQRRERGEAGGLAVLRRRLELSAAAFRDLYNSFGKTQPRHNDENPAVVFDRAAEQVCRACEQCRQCWDRSYIDTFNALNDATPAMMRRGRSLPEDYPEHFRQRCVRLPQLLAAVNREVTALLLRRQYSRSLDAERQRVRGQYAQLSEFLNQAAQLSDAAVPAYGGPCPCQVGGAWRPKEGESVCGDTIAHFETDSGLICLLLCDGMGSGEEARRESANAARLLEQFLKAGVEAESALRTVNAALSLRSDDTGAFTTVDLALLDRKSRQVSLYKYGAAPTYIKRHGTVRKLTGTALPAGLQEIQAVPAPIRFPLEQDAFLVLLSDGVVDTGDDEWLQNLLAGWQGAEPQRLVSLILGESRGHGGLRDDCSVLCLHLAAGDREV